MVDALVRGVLMTRLMKGWEPNDNMAMGRVGDWFT